MLSFYLSLFDPNPENQRRARPSAILSDTGPQLSHMRPGTKRKHVDSVNLAASASKSSVASTSDHSCSVEENPKKMKTSDAARRASLVRARSQLGGYAYEWIAKYRSSAPLVRLLMQPPSGEVQVKSTSYILRMIRAADAVLQIRLTTTEADGTEHSKIYMPFSSTAANMLAFEDLLKRIRKEVAFPKVAELPAQYTAVRNEVLEAVRSIQMVHTTLIDSDRAGWNFKRDSDNRVVLSPEAEVIFSAMRTAFKLDMKNGDGKNFLIDTAEAFATIFKGSHIVKSYPPVYGHGSNSSVELVMEGDTENYQRPLSMRTPHLSFVEDEDSPDYDPRCRIYFPTMEPKEEVPDVVWATKGFRTTDGIFLLTSEVKQQIYFEEGSFQSLKQVLSKLHFQDVCFGLFITPMQFRLRVAFKDTRGTSDAIYFGSYIDEFAVGVDEQRPFEVEVFGTLLDWLARIYMFGMRHTRLQE